MKQNFKEIEINGIIYIPKDSVNKLAENKNNMPFVMIRSYEAGVFFGYLKEKISQEKRVDVILLDSRRVWYWDGAASLSELAAKGTSNPSKCKFPCIIEGDHEIINVIEIIPITEVAKKSLEGVEIWTNH